MKASLRSVRIAPKKAQLVAKMIRGKSVPDAVHILEHTNKKAARLLEQLLRSAMANASHNEKQDPQMMVVKLLTVNKAQAYHRGVPMARGRVRPMRKFLSHIDLTLGILDAEVDSDDQQKQKKQKQQRNSSESSLSSVTSKSSTNASQTAKKPVKSVSTKNASTSTKGKSSAKKDTAASPSKSSTSKKSSSNKK